MTTERDVEANRRVGIAAECQRLRRQLSETLRARKDAEARALQQEEEFRGKITALKNSLDSGSMDLQVRLSRAEAELRTAKDRISALLTEMTRMKREAAASEAAFVSAAAAAAAAAAHSGGGGGEYGAASGLGDVQRSTAAAPSSSELGDFVAKMVERPPATVLATIPIDGGVGRVLPRDDEI